MSSDTRLNVQTTMTGSETRPGVSPHQATNTSNDTISTTENSAEPTRRAMIGTAMAGIDRFKKSWISVMILKSSIGLSQVIVLITLLILASVIDSPLYPGKAQSTPSPTCPKPQLFQAWMIINICRLTICWMVSCWMCIRFQRSRRQDDDEERSMSTVTNGNDAPLVSNGIPHSDTIPSLTFSTASTSSATIDALSSSSHSTPISENSPDTVHIPQMESNLWLIAAEPYTTENKSRNSGVQSYAQQSPSGETLVNSRLSSYRTTPQTPCSTTAQDDSLQAARNLHDGREQSEEEPAAPRGFAAWLDRWALTISKFLGAISAVLFILGNVLVFHPGPGSQDTCYHAAPMLWWGVMTVVAIGWILFGQIFFVVVIVGIGGQAVLAFLRRIGVITPPPEPEPARPALPEVLTLAELNRLKLVIYLPDPNEKIESDGTHDSRPRHTIDPSRLTHPPIYLPSHKSTCAICQETFKPPKEGRSILLKARPLRLLGCGHVYHTECIDQWLLEGHGNCPFCNRSVRQIWEEEDVERARSEKVKLTERSRRRG